MQNPPDKAAARAALQMAFDAARKAAGENGAPLVLTVQADGLHAHVAIQADLSNEEMAHALFALAQQAARGARANGCGCAHCTADALSYDAIAYGARRMIQRRNAGDAEAPAQPAPATAPAETLH